MASYAGTEYVPTQVSSNINAGLVGQVLSMKQQTYNQHKSQIQETLDSFGSLDILRPEDQDYVANKISSVVSSINSYGNRDLSLAGVNDDIMSTVKSVANDPIVLDAIANTQKYRQFQTQVNQIREKKPELYSDVNYNYALTQAGFDKYLNGESNSIGNLNYSNYVDVTSSALKKIKELKDLKGERTIELPDPQNPGLSIKKSIKGLTDQEIFDYVPGILTPEESQQLGINGWAKYGRDLPAAQKSLESYKTDLISNIDENIENAESIINNSLTTTDQKKDAQLRLASYQRQKEQTNNEIGSIDVNNAASIGGFLEKNSFMYGIAKAGKAEWSTEYEKDDYYFAKKDLELSQQREQRLRAQDALSAEKAILENAKLRKELGVDANGNPVIDNQAISFSAKEGELIDEVNPYNDQVSQFNNVTGEMTGLITQAVNSDRTTDDVRNNYATELKKFGYDTNGNVLPGKEKIAKATPKSLAMKTAFDRANVGAIHGEIAKKLAGIELKRNNIASELNKNKTTGLTEAWNSGADKYIFRMYDLISAANNDKETDFSSDADAEEIYSLWQEATNFVKENGGSHDNLKKALQNNPQKIAQFAEIQQKLENRPAPITGQISRFIGNLNPVAAYEAIRGANLSQDAVKIANQNSRNRISNKQAASFTTGEIGTIASKSVRERIVNMIPQTGGNQLFDAENPISFQMTPAGEIEIIQNKGYAKSSKQGKLMDARVTVSSKDAAFNELIKYVDLNERQRGLDARVSSVKVKPSTTISYLDSNKKTVLNRTDSYISNLAPETLKTFSANPLHYLTKNRTEDAFKSALNNRVPEAKIEQLVDVLSKNIDKIQPELKAIDGNWAINISTNRGKTLAEGDTGMTYLSDDMAYLMKSYPQVLATDGVLKYLLENPREVDTLIQNLQN